MCGVWCKRLRQKLNTSSNYNERKTTKIQSLAGKAQPQAWATFKIELAQGARKSYHIFLLSFPPNPISKMISYFFPQDRLFNHLIVNLNILSQPTIHREQQNICSILKELKKILSFTHFNSNFTTFVIEKDTETIPFQLRQKVTIS